MAGSSGEQGSFWAKSSVEHSLQILREEFNAEVGTELRILKVPEYSRQPSVEYTPVEWRFGLHNRNEKLVMSDSETAKRALLVMFGLDRASAWTTFCDVVVPDPWAMLRCYGLHKEVNDLLEDEIKHMLAFDALLLAAWIDSMEAIPSEFKKLFSHASGWNKFYRNFGRCFDLIHRDVCKIEKQIPFGLIERAINHIEKLNTRGQEYTESHASHYDAKASQVYLENWMWLGVQSGMGAFMDISAEFYGEANATEMVSKSHHILDAAYKAICGVDGMERTSDFSQENYIHVPSAMRLKESGIKIQEVSRPLSGMSYDKEKKCLFLSMMYLYDSTVPIVRNMARYEEYVEGNKCMLHDYVFLMLDLIQTPEDMNHLVKCGVVYNANGRKGVDTWGQLHKGLNLESSSKKHNEMKSDIKERGKLRRHKLWSEFKTLFLSRPWLTLSTVVITLVTFATLIQTYAAIISSNGMKPQFKP